MSSLISIIIPIYNGALLIERCLDAIYQQNGDYQLEVIVIDDGSADNSLEIVQQYPKPIAILQQHNQGPAVARNVGIEAATGKYLAFLDADDYWLPDFLIKTINFLLQHPEAIAVSTAQIHKIPGKKDIVSPSFVSDDKIEFTDSIILDNFYKFWSEHKHVCTGSVLIKTSIVKKTGGQLKELRISEDLEFWSYLGTFGKWGFIPQILFVSDGGVVTKQRGWLKKNMIRWKATPSIETFSKRTLSGLNEEDKKHYNGVLGWVSYNFTYGHIMAFNFKKAYQLTIAKSNYFPQTKLSKFYRLTSKLGIVAFSLCAFTLREIQIVRQILKN